ncbi:MAG: heavy metal translocating P-type ATPase [Pseudomonadota bacterium]|nr:heavy metal translocating P-type ATPase [Pseudomonadota bacterium]
MSCCAPGIEESLPQAGAPRDDREIFLASRDLGDGSLQTTLSVPGVHCGACIRTVEKAIGALDGVDQARLNLSTRRLSVTWRPAAIEPSKLFGVLEDACYPAFLADPAQTGRDPALRELLVALGVAGFAAGNVMLLSVSVWSGAEGPTRDLFHWISAMIALPAIVFAGRPFFRPAWQALKAGRLNLDVPISLAVILAAAMSVYETANHGEHAYFDAAVSLLFFLLIGRTLDHVMRERARSAVHALARMAPRGAVVIAADGRRDFMPVGDIRPGMRLAVAAGERLPVDGVVRAGTGDLDFSIVNGESTPVAARPGLAVPAGVINTTGPLEIEAAAAARDSFIAEMMRLMEAAESSRAGFRRLADRAAEIYAPVVHLLALATFVFWIAMGAGWHSAMVTAIAVLIITCPCALGLAVPIVQVVAAGRLFRDGIMVKSGAALERLAGIDRAVFDKTGTLSAGTPRLLEVEESDRTAPGGSALDLAGAIARQSRHPYSRAIAAAASDPGAVPVHDLRELPGFGLEGRLDGRVVRLGRPDWALRDGGTADDDGIVLAIDGERLARFRFEDPLRPGARQALGMLAGQGIEVEILSGDGAARVAETARKLGIASHAARCTPAEKLARLEELAGGGHRALMVGDGINDAPALAGAHVSFAPSGAADIGRNAADFVFLRDDLRAIPAALDIARRARSLILQNFGLAVAYNAIAIPLAVAGYATPLVAALAMSSSSVLVTLNALRLNLVRTPLSSGQGEAHARTGTVPLRAAEHLS